MKIAFITFEYPPDNGKGGIATYTNQVCKLLSDTDDVHVFASSSFRQEVEKDQAITVHWILSKDPSDFRIKVVNDFTKVHSIENFDVIESAEIHGNAWEIVKRYSTLPLIVRLHAPNYLVEHLKKRYLPFWVKARFVLGALRQGKIDLGYWRKYDKADDPDYRFACLANHLTAPSSYMKEWAVKNWQISPDRISVVANPFIHYDKLLDIPIAEKQCANEIIFFGRLNVLKGLVNATKAVKKILKEHPDWQFKIIGDDGQGPMPGTKMTMKDWMQKELEDVINQVNFIPGFDYLQLPGLLKEGKIVLLPSLFESFSYTCIEAMAAGKAVIGSKVGGMADLIQHNINGLLIEPNNISEIYRALKKMILEPDKLNVFAQRARQKVLSFDSQLLKQNYLNIYKEVVGHKGFSCNI